LVAGFLYWMLFLLVLEPGNVFGSAGRLVASQELLRIVGASVIGAGITPPLVAMVLRFPVEGNVAWRNAAVHLALCLVVSAALIAVSCVLADRLLVSERRPFALALGEEFETNWPLVAFCVAGLCALAHTRLFRQADKSEPVPFAEKSPPEAGYLASISVKARGRLTYLQLSDVDWIETQGNYLALHRNAESHLVRDSLANILARLDPGHFARVHRRTVVAIDRVREVVPLGAGDACLRLRDGTELRLSRTYRAAFFRARNS